MDLNYHRLIRQKQELKEQKENEYKKSSQERLGKIIETKMKTIMIGALAVIEQEFGHLWKKGAMTKLTKEEESLLRTYEKIRKDILDKGNLQIRNVKQELEQYEIEWKRYNIVLPVKS